METPASLIETLIDKVEAYGKSTYELSKLRSVEKTTKVATVLISKISFLLMTSMFVFVFSLGVAYYLGELLGKLYYGFFIVAGFYLLLAIIFHFYLHKGIRKPVSELIIEQAL